MGFLSKWFKPSPSRLMRLPSGSFTVDRDGRVITYTLPQTFPVGHMQEIGREVLAYFRGAQQAQMPVKELVVNYPSLKLTARELRGGAIVFLAPQSLTKN
ncbi:MAG: hypothetical protein HZA90_10145 [Verrucomicrobia bacterium]|nr:hypothetical protein [Verrucomicrobiota bacterium]